MLLESLFRDVSASSIHDERFWGGGDNIITASGVAITTETSMRHSAVYAAVRLLSETLASLPIGVYRRRADGGKDLLYDHPLYNLLHYQPNDYQSSFEWREMMQGHAVLRGNSYAFKDVDNRGQIRSLDPLHPNRVKPEWTDTGRIIYKVKEPHGVGFTENIYTSDEIFHIRGLSFDGLIGLNPIEYHRETVGQGMAAQEYGARFFANDATPRTALEYPGNFKDDEAFHDFRKRWQQQQTGSNRHKTAILENGMTIKEIGMTNEDAQYIETRKYNVTDIARIFNIPPHMIGDLEKATFSNISDQAIQFVVHTMRPWLVRWEQAFKRDMIVEDDIFVEFNVDGLLRGDPAARTAYYNGGVNGGWLTRNEVRQRENYNPLDGLDEPLTPMNMQGGNQRGQDMEKSAAARIARKELKAIRAGGVDRLKQGNHRGFISSVLMVDDSVADRAYNDLMALFGEDILLDDFIELRTNGLLQLLKA